MVGIMPSLGQFRPKLGRCHSRCGQIQAKLDGAQTQFERTCGLNGRALSRVDRSQTCLANSKPNFVRDNSVRCCTNRGQSQAKTRRNFGRDHAQFGRARLNWSIRNSIFVRRSGPNLSSSPRSGRFGAKSGRNSADSGQPRARFPELGQIWPQFVRTSADFGRTRPKFGRTSVKFGRL